MFELNRLYNMDCMKAMQEIPDKFFELAICDPPYGIGMDGGCVGYRGKNVFEKKNWDKATPPPEYFRELMRISVNQVIWGGNYFNLPPTRCFLIWDKGAGFKGRSYAEAELAWTSFDKNVRVFTYDPLCRGDYKGKIHPTQKPVALYEWVISKFAKDGDKIIDTHAGSGSCCIAAHRMRHEWIGFEIDESYYKKADERIRQEMAQMSIFDFMGGNSFHT